MIKEKRGEKREGHGKQNEKEDEVTGGKGKMMREKALSNSSSLHVYLRLL